MSASQEGASRCTHGGQSFEAIGVGFDALERPGDVVTADVLDAWFPPAPQVLDVLRAHLGWIVASSPPTHADGMVAAIARHRGVPEECVVPSGGSSELITAALPRWLTARSRALLLDPTYGEYAFVLEQRIGCRVERLLLSRARHYDVDLDALRRGLAAGPDLVVLVNPNSPTGRHVPRADLATVLRDVPARTRVWIDETYVDFADPAASLETLAAASASVVVCKSMSKAYALSGVRAAYLVAPRALAAELRDALPPWPLSLPGQIAAVHALAADEYYRARWRETAALREELARALRALGFDVVPAVANFLLCHLPPRAPDTAAVLASCRAAGVFLRDMSGMTRRPDERMVRIAVKDAAGNARIVAALARALHVTPPAPRARDGAAADPPTTRARRGSADGAAAPTPP